MPGTSEHCLRHLRVAFTTTELASLRPETRFNEALLACDGSTDGIESLIRLGAAILAERERNASKLPHLGNEEQPSRAAN
jgi:hypothetical protein